MAKITRRAVTAAIAALFSSPIAGSAAQAAAAPAPIGVDVKASLDKPLLLSGERQTAYLRIAIEIAKREGGSRAPMNIALVIDRSGSMSSDRRIDNARKAANLAVERLNRDDILALVSYDDKVDVDVPATKITDAEAIKVKIARLTPRGSTAIHAGLLAAANEVRKFKSKDRVNRIILLSDGLANVGPSSPSDFVSLGKELASEGITVSTLGLGTGYNEDLMSGLARAADGGHAFVQESADLSAFIGREFDDTLGIAGQQAEIIVTLAEGVRPVRTLGREAEIKNGKIIYRVGALFGGAEQILISELAIDPQSGLDERSIAKIEVSYTDPSNGQRIVTAAAANARFTSDREASLKSIDPIVDREVATLVSRAARQDAVRLRDEGKISDAKRAFEENAKYLSAKKAALPAAAQTYQPLDDELAASSSAAANADKHGEAWGKERKMQRQIDSNKAGASTKY